MSTKKEILISFAIPNYNKGVELDEALESIYLLVKENLNFVEICISDNASDDVSKDVILLWEKKFLNFQYSFNDKNIGFQKNIIKALSMTSGSYTWIFGSDDTISNEARFKYLTSLLSNENEMYLINRMLCSDKLKPYAVDNYFKIKLNSRTTWNWSNEKEYLTYLNNAKTVDALGCFISTVILSREIIEELLSLAKVDSFYQYNIFPHVYLLQKIKKNKFFFNVTYEPNPLVNWRGNNSSFIDNQYDKYIDLLDIANSVYSRKDIDIKISIINLIYNNYKKSMRFRSWIKQIIKGDFKNNKSQSLAYRYDFNSNLKYKFSKLFL